MKHSEVLSRYVNTGTRIPEKQFDRLSKSLQKSYIRMRGVAGYEGWEFKTFSDVEKIKYIEKKGEKFSADLIYVFISNSQNIDLIATKIIQTIGEKLNDDDITYLFENSVNKDLIGTKFIELEIDIPEDVYMGLSPSLQKSYLRIRSMDRYFGWEFKVLNDDERIKYIEKEDVELNGDDITDLVEYAQNKDLIATKIIEVKGKNLYSNIMYPLVKYSVNKDNIATKIINLKGKELEKDLFRSLLYYSKNKDDIAIKIIEAKDKIFYDDEEINILLDYAQNKDLIATKIIEGGSQIPEKQYNILSQSFQKSYKRIRGVHGYYGWEFKLLTDNEKINYIEKEKDKRLEIRDLLDYSQNKDLIATKIIEKFGEKLSGLDMLPLFKNSEDKELIKKTLLQNGVNYERINKLITNARLNIPLIPDNYQSMLNEIRRIKEIMK